MLLRLICAVLALACISGPTQARWKRSSVPGSGIASWYGGKHHGRRTASGERFNMHAMTAAHRTLPFGTRVRVCLARRCVVVRVNDRGPFIRGRSLDLSSAAARAIGMGGTGRVSMQVLGR